MSGELSLREGSDVWSARFAEDITSVVVDPDTLDLDVAVMLPLVAARKATAVALRRDISGEVIVALADPSDLNALDEVRGAMPAGTRLQFRRGDAGKIEQCLRVLTRLYVQDSESGTLAMLGEQGNETPAEIEEQDEAASGPVVRLFDDLLASAVARGASDIHLEAQPDGLLARMRVDTVMREHRRLPANIAVALVRRVKIISKMDIADRLRFQDGRFEAIVDGRRFDARVVTLPSAHGEDVVIRLFDTGRSVRKLSALGLADPVLDGLMRAISNPHGLVVVCGPTGSGKTTTLHGALQTVAGPHLKVCAVEDPVEIKMPGITQIQVNSAASVSFASSLRAFLRSDPDIILVGEVRDSETAQLVVQAAQTGHLVLTTLHTNSSASAPSRITDLGADPWLVADTLKAVLSQRLVRRLCPDCATAVAPDAGVVSALYRAGVDVDELDISMLREAGPGCSACDRTGFRGMVCVGELLEVDDKMSTLIASRAAATELAAHSYEMGHKTMSSHAAHLVAAGVTDLREIRRIGL